MSIKFIKFDEEILRERVSNKDQNYLPADFIYLLENLREFGYTLDFEQKLTIKQIKTEETASIKMSKELFIKKLNEKSEQISNYIKDLYQLEDVKITDIDGFISEYANENENSLDTIKVVREKT
jgi:hypothetical protein